MKNIRTSKHLNKIEYYAGGCFLPREVIYGHVYIWKHFEPEPFEAHPTKIELFLYKTGIIEFKLTVLLGWNSFPLYGRKYLWSFQECRGRFAILWQKGRQMGFCISPSEKNVRHVTKKKTKITYVAVGGWIVYEFRKGFKTTQMSAKLDGGSRVLQAPQHFPNQLNFFLDRVYG